ncbi:fibroleukin-like [Saccostrea echinata]|uniref:fibroleukin-like n=1 Tax=Saccostrea echinata TaxID=191078 RepID=UPI002A834940|nr:fibroleukin-like [Saccostrea echinata]
MTTDGGGWTVIQKREDDDVDFYRTWNEYKHGFGNASKNYWIGNDAIHALTKDQDQELRVDLKRFNGDTAYAEYSTFYIGNEADKYRLTVSGYNGTAGDSLVPHNGMRFSTKDQDNDIVSYSCANSHHGAWWYFACTHSNLNGKYAQSAVTSYKCPYWYRWTNGYKALQRTVMMIRRKRTSWKTTVLKADAYINLARYQILSVDVRQLPYIQVSPRIIPRRRNISVLTCNRMKSNVTKMHILQSLVFLVLFLNVGLVSADSNNLEKSILDGSTTSGGKVSNVLRDILNQESLVRFSMVQRIQNLVMDVIDSKNNSQMTKQKLKILTTELKDLETRDNGIETEVTILKQVLQVLNETEQMKQMKNRELDVRNKTRELSTYNDLYREQLNVVKNALRELKGSMYEGRFQKMENTFKNYSKSINETLDGLFEDHKVLNLQVLNVSSSLSDVINSDITSVFCDMTTDGGGWTAIQKRKDGSTEFYRTWEEYKQGFGDPKNNYWIGNDAIHALTKDQDQELRVDLQRFNGDTAYAEYSTFYIGNEPDKYQLTLSRYTGTAGDSLIYHNGSKFSTKDQDNDRDGGNCATSWLGAWWYKSCHYSNLNGQYAQSALIGDKYPIWYRWKKHEALKQTVMMIRYRI